MTIYIIFPDNDMELRQIYFLKKGPQDGSITVVLQSDYKEAINGCGGRKCVYTVYYKGDDVSKAF